MFASSSSPASTPALYASTPAAASSDTSASASWLRQVLSWSTNTMRIPPPRNANGPVTGIPDRAALDKPSEEAGSVAATDLALHFLHAHVAHVGAMHQVNDIFAHVLGMIADALQRPRRPHHVENAANAARILHHEGDALTHDGFVFAVDALILAGHRDGGLRIKPREGVEGSVQHAAHSVAEVVELDVAVRRPLHLGE